MEIKNIFKQTNSMWVKYSDYQIRNVNNIEYILPAAGAKFSVYDSAENTAELVADAIQTGQMIADNENNNEEIKRAMFSFTRKHGLIGWMMALPLEKTFDDQKQVYLGRNGALLKKTAMPTDKYYDFFLGASETPRDEQTFPPLIAYTVKREPEYEKAFSVYYGEPLLWTAAWLIDLYHHFFSCKNHDKPAFTHNERMVMRKKASNFEHSGITYNLTATGQPKISWQFDSLKTVIETAYGLMLTDESQPLRICKNCGTVYHNANTRSEFCGVKCRNQFNVREFRKRKNEER